MRFSYLSKLFIILLPIIIVFSIRGLNSQESYLMYSTEKFLQGQAIYKDFSFNYTPLSVILNSLSFSFFGHSILSARLLMIGIACISLYLLNRIIFYATKNTFYAVISSLLFVAWWINENFFATAENFSVLFVLFAIFLLFKFLETRSLKFLFLVGFTSSLLIITHQILGIFFLAGIVSFFAVKSSRNIYYLLYWIYGFIWGYILLAIYILLTDSFQSFIYTFQTNSLHLVTMTLQQVNSTSILANSLSMMLSVICIFLLYIRRRFHLIFPVIIFGILNIASFSNVTFFMIIGIPISLLLRYNISSNIRILLLIFSFVLVVVGFRNALFTGTHSVISQNVYFDNNKVKIFADKTTVSNLSSIQSLTQSTTDKNDYIYFDTSQPLLYFLAERKEAIPFSELINNKKTHQPKVLGNLIAKEAKILGISNIKNFDKALHDYISSHYDLKQSYSGINIYLRKLDTDINTP